MTAQTPPPLPKLSADKENGVPDATNDWRTLVETVPIFAEPVANASTNTGKIMVPATNSCFRTGVMQFDESGITMDGLAVRLFPLWFPLVSGVVGFCSFIFYFALSLGKRLGLSFSAQMTLGLLLAVFLICQQIMSAYLNRQRVETKLFLAWESLYSLGVDPELKQITLVYTSLAVPRSKETLREYITLKKLDPNTVQGIITTILHFAPHVLRFDTVNNQRVRPLWIISVVLGIVTFVFIVAFVIIYLRRHHII